MTKFSAVQARAAAVLFASDTGSNGRRLIRLIFGSPLCQLLLPFGFALTAIDIAKRFHKQGGIIVIRRFGEISIDASYKNIVGVEIFFEKPVGNQLTGSIKLFRF